MSFVVGRWFHGYSASGCESAHNSRSRVQQKQKQNQHAVLIARKYAPHSCSVSAHGSVKSHLSDIHGYRQQNGKTKTIKRTPFAVSHMVRIRFQVFLSEAAKLVITYTHRPRDREWEGEKKCGRTIVARKWMQMQLKLKRLKLASTILIII